MDAQLLVQLIGPPCGALVAVSGAVLAVCRVIMSTLRERARSRWLAASPTDRELLGPIPPPYPAAPIAPALLLLLGGSLSIGVPFATGQAHPIATLQRLGVLEQDQPAAQRPPACTKATCPPPAACTANGCEGNALPPAPAEPAPLKASLRHGRRLDSAIALDGSQIGEPSAHAQLHGWAL